MRDNLFNDNGSVSSIFIDFGTNLAPPCIQEVKINQGTVSVFEPGVSGLKLQAYPNPVSDQLTVAATAIVAGEATLEIYAPTGQLLVKQAVALSVGENSFQLSSADWPVGVYSVRITDGSSERRVKVVKVR